MAGENHVANVPNGESDELPILIIGSGSTGVALAQGLLKAGIKSIIFEKDASQARERDWNMGLHWGVPILKSLMPDDMWSQIPSIQPDPHMLNNDDFKFLFLHGATGETIADTSIGTLYRLRRSKLRALLSQGLDIRYKKRLAYVTFAHDKTSVTAYFTDGTSVSGRFLVGADGAHSMVRCCLLGPDLGAVNRLPYATSFVISSFTKDQAIFLRSFHPLLLASAHPDGLFGFFGLHDASIADDPASWTFIFYISQHRTLTEQGEDANLTSAQRLAQLKELAKNFCDPWKSAFEWTADDTPCWYSGLMDWDPSLEAHRWDNHGGLATLVGDACHCMTFQRGQGLNHSIADAGQLRDALVEIRDGGDREKVIAAFEEKMVARSGGEVRESTANTVMVHDWEKVKLSALFTKGMHKRE